MSKKVYELAKELDMESKELLEKINSMGIEAKSHSSVVSDMDAQAITNMVHHQKKKIAETMIVTAGPEKKESKQNEQGDVKIAVKPAAVMMKMKDKPEQKQRAESSPAVHRTGAQPPTGTPLPRTTSAQPPTGTPLPKNSSAQPPIGTPLPRAASAAPPIGTPLPRAASAAPPVGVPLPKSASKQPLKDEPVENITLSQSLKEELPRQREAGNAEIDHGYAEKEQPVLPEKAETTVAAPIALETQMAPAEAAQGKSSKPVLESTDAVKSGYEKQAGEQRTQSTPDDRRDQRPSGDQRGPRPADDRRDQRPTGDQRGPRPADDRRDQRPSGDQRGPRPSGDQRGPRPAGDQRGPRPAGDQRGPRPAGDQRGPRPAGDSRGPRPAGDQRGQTGRSAGPVDSGRAKPAANDSSRGHSDHKSRPDTQSKVAQKPDYKKSKDKPEKDKYGLKSMEKPAVKKPHKQKAQKPQEPERKIILEDLEPGTKIINVPITVKGLSEQIGKSTSDVIMALMKMGIMANINQNLDEDMVALIGTELGVSVVVDKIEEEVIEEGLELYEDQEKDLVPRPPIITVMGHVDHGKTSLLDAIRKTNVTTTESGGITQHIGASEVTIKGQKIVFLDTPGHEAFTTMRARGAHVTDIAVLVVAADDSVKPQTVESISHAKAAGVPVIVAINKMDKPDANPDRVKQDLTEHGILVEEWGGDTICVPVSAKTGDGIVNLLEMILLQAEVLELKANPNRQASGTVIEARLDKSKGPVATLLVLNGTLQAGNSCVAGTSSGRIRAMTNYKGDTIRKAGPATAVEITGLTEVPEAGDEFHSVKEDRVAREIAEQRKLKLREEVMARNSSVTLEQLFNQINEGEVKELNLIIKADVQGSVGALTQSLEKLKTENVKVKIIHTGVGTVTESDIMLASTSNAIIIGFNVRPSTNISQLAEREKVEIRSYRIIYEIIDDIEAALKGMLDPIYKEVILGKVEIRNTFKVPGVGMIGGAYVLEGKVQRNAEIRLLRDGIIIHQGRISSLKRYKDDAKEVAQGYECGIGIDNFNDIKDGDLVEVFKMEEIVRK